MDIMTSNTYIPMEVAHSASISSTSKIIYSEILTITATEGACTLTNKELEKMHRTSASTIERSIRELKETGCIRIEHNQDGARRKLVPLIGLDGLKEFIERSEQHE